MFLVMVMIVMLAMMTDFDGDIPNDDDDLSSKSLLWQSTLCPRSSNAVSSLSGGSCQRSSNILVDFNYDAADSYKAGGNMDLDDSDSNDDD